MLDNIENIAFEYLDQKSHYRNALIGNPFTARSGAKFACGIVNSRHNPAALVGLHKLVKWENAPLFYFRYFVTHLDYKELKRIMLRVKLRYKHVDLMIARFPEKYGTICCEASLHMHTPVFDYLRNPLILNLSANGANALLSLICYRFGVLEEFYNTFVKYITDRGQVDKPKYYNIGQFCEGGLIRNSDIAASKREYLWMLIKDIKKYGDFQDLTILLRLLKNERAHVQEFF